MDEDISVKAPVTRLRRRMSVEGEDSPLPTTPSTPTKKRATRLAAKPQLELIDEVATENVPKRSTRKVAVKENIEADTNTGTPTPVTPSRRSTRIRSNTSILSETTTQNIESPRAKRALRRNSQLGSDTESSALTPARSTRRMRKDSTTNIDKQVGDESMVVSSTNTEDTEKDPKDSKTNETDDLSPSTRKSPRLQTRTQNKKGGKTEIPDKEANKSINNNKSPQDATPNKTNHVEVNDIDATVIDSEKDKLKNKTNISKNNNMNKSTSAIDKIANDLMNKRNRTKSWTTLTSPSNVVNNEESKPAIKGNSANTSITGSGDGCDEDPKIEVESNSKSPNKSINTSKSLSNKDAVDSFETLDYNKTKSDTAKLFEKSPFNQEPMVLIEDSDSCSGKLSMDIQMDGEDQCVPVVVNPTKESPKKSEHDVEPMDIDESMPVNVTIEDYSDKSNTSKDDVEVSDKRKSSVSEKSIIKDESINKSKRKSLIRSDTEHEENTIDSMNKSNKNSPISSKTNSSISEQETKNKSLKETSLLEYESRETSNKSQRKSSISVENNEKLNESSNKSKRKSSVSINNSVNMNESTKSQGNTSISVGSQFLVDDQNVEQKLNESANESRRKSSVSVNNSAVNNSKNSLDKSQSKSSVSIDDDNGKLDESLKNSKRKSSISFAVDQSESKEALNSSKKKSMSVSEDNADKLDGSLTTSKRKTSISLNNSAVIQKSTINESNDCSSKQNKNSSISQSDNDNKSTLVISQLKDVSTNDTNNAMSPNVTNNQLSKSMNDPDIKNKVIDKKNLSLNYLTSTPIQQKSLQKLAMQINTSIISPCVESKNNTSGNTAQKNTPKTTVNSDFSDKSDEEIKFKNSKVISKNSVTPKKMYARALSSSDSSDNESDTETKNPNRVAVKKSPNKKQLDGSSSDDDTTDSDNRNGTKKPLNKKQNLSMSNSMRTNKTKTPNKKPPSDSSDYEESEQEAPKDRSKMVDDEASDAGEDYESGDSQNEADRIYEAENEIVEKGETLDSDDEFSNDSDYEKDSFLVSSDAEDNEILSGTGDDLSMSDNELTMSAKSKSKFNERKLKQQKNASREMYEARHKLDESSNSTKSETKFKKSKRQRLESSALESDNENSQPKKNNRRRIDSSQDSSLVKSDADESVGIKKKKSKRLSESVHDITTNEKEITINQSTTEKNDPLSVAIKQEPKTPLRNFDISTVAINDKIEEVEVDANASILKQNESLDPLQTSMKSDDDDDVSSSSDNMEIIQNYDSVLNNLSMQTKKIKTADTSLNLNKKSKDSKNPVIDQLNLTQVKQSKKNKKAVAEKKPESVPQATRKSKVKDDDDSSDSIDMKLLFPEDSNDSEINASQFKSKTAEDPEEYFIPLKRTEAQTNISKNMDTSESELNVSKKKKRKSSISVPEEGPNNAEESEDSKIKIFIDTTGTHQEVELETSVVQTNSSKKKNKKNKSLNKSTAIENAVEVDCTDGAMETHVEISFTSEKKKKKNKNKSFDVSVNKTETSITEILSEPKRRKSESTSFSEAQNENTENTIIQETPVNISIKSDKKKNKNVSLIIEETDSSNSAKKAKTTSISVEPETENAEAETSINSEKKKKKKNKKKNKHNLDNSQTNVDNAGEDSDDAPVEMSYKSEKKSGATDTVTDEAASSIEKKKHKKNKKKKNKNLSQSMEKSDDAGHIEEVCDESTKRKRKSSGNSITEEPISVASNEKKKRKVHLDDECLAAYNNTELNNEEGTSKKSKKNKKNKNLDNFAQDELPKETKKRKNRDDDDDDEKIHKVSKQSSFDKIHVPKIPESVVKQLTENPRNIVSGKLQNNIPKMKKKKANTVIATMPFVVEEAERRKNKPSNYLEQSIYLNDSPVKTKQKRFKDKPKVLPFTPTALTSDSGYTSKFNINVLPGQTQFVAQASNVDNFRESYLGNQRIKKMGTLERFKLHRSHKISKF